MGFSYVAGVEIRPPGHHCRSEIPGLRQMMIEARRVPAADRPALVEILMNSPEALDGNAYGRGSRPTPHSKAPAPRVGSAHDEDVVHG